MLKVAVTGASGFVGHALIQELSNLRKFAVLGLVRSPVLHSVADVTYLNIGNLTEDIDRSSVLIGVDTLVHVAARVHIMNELAVDPLAEFRLTNVTATLNLARQAVRSGVRRFIYISSVKVNGETTVLDHPFTEEDIPCPLDSYGVSKMEAEIALRSLALETGMDVVIIRPPLIYGPGVKANFANMMHLIVRKLPLPLAAINNKRSFLALDNLVNFIVTCILHEGAANQTFLVSDGDDISTPDLLTRLALALNVPIRIFSIRLSILMLGASMLNKKDIAQRVCSSLQVDIQKSHRVLGWVPPVSVDAALHKTAIHFKKSI